MKTFQVAAVIALTGIVVMVVGEVWSLSAANDYTSAETRQIAAYEDSDENAYIQASWDMHNAWNSNILASTVFDFGFIVVALGVAVIAFGLHERENPAPQRAYYYPQAAPSYPVGYPPQGYPPPGYQYPPPQPPKQ